MTNEIAYFDENDRLVKIVPPEKRAFERAVEKNLKRRRDEENLQKAKKRWKTIQLFEELNIRWIDDEI